MMIKNLLMVSVICLLPCAGGFADESDAGVAMRISLTVNSGLPDPGWTLFEKTTKDDFRQLNEMLTQTRSGPKVKKPQPSPHMGYHGFRISRGKFSEVEKIASPAQEDVSIEDGVACFVTIVTEARAEDMSRDDWVEVDECLRKQWSFRLAQEEMGKIVRDAPGKFKQIGRRDMAHFDPGPCYQETCYKDSHDLETYLCRQALRRVDDAVFWLGDCK